MSDGPHKSLPMRHHWRNLAERATTPAFTAEQVAEAFSVVLKNDFREAPLAQLRDIFDDNAQSSLFQEDRVAQLEAMRSECRGSAAGNTLIDCALEAYANGLTGDVACRTALENALDTHARAGCHQIEEHYRRKEPQSTANIRDRLNSTRRQCRRSEIASELMSDGGSKPRLPKRTGIDEGSTVMISSVTAIRIPKIMIDVVEPGRRTREGRRCFELGCDVRFSTAGLEAYAFAQWEPVVYDAMVVGAVIEYGDRILKRPPCGWARSISIHIPVDDPDRWNAPAVATALHEAVGFLTGDYWTLEFVRRSTKVPSPSQDYLNLPIKTKAVLPYSDGMDSRIVAGIVSQTLGNDLIRVRVGSKSWDHKNAKNREPFMTVPYDVPCNMPNREVSGRSRGFKFALISGVAAYLANADEIVIPESGQGAIGPALLNVGHAYPDYRNHLWFTRRMEQFLNSLLGTRLRFVFPRLWSTKGETLREFVALSGEGDWETTRSCWRNNQWSSVNGKWRQCGVCAACMLRRVSVHAAGLTEAPETYVATNMSAKTLKEAIDRDFTRQTRAFNEYAIAGVLYMDHLADMAEPDDAPLIKTHATLLARAVGLSREETKERLSALFQKHAEEWNGYLGSLGGQSFVKLWVRRNR